MLTCFFFLLDDVVVIAVGFCFPNTDGSCFYLGYLLFTAATILTFTRTSCSSKYLELGASCIILLDSPGDGGHLVKGSDLYIIAVRGGGTREETESYFGL